MPKASRFILAVALTLSAFGVGCSSTHSENWRLSLLSETADLKAVERAVAELIGVNVPASAAASLQLTPSVSLHRKQLFSRDVQRPILVLLETNGEKCRLRQDQTEHLVLLKPTDCRLKW